MDDPHFLLVDGCLSGDSKSFEQVFKIYQPKIFSLALKFLWNPEDSEDATQEILLKVLSNLSGFRRESKFSTWVFRIATNHLINFKKSILERNEINFRKVEVELHKSNSISDDNSENARYLAAHVQAACTHAILQCLKRSYRIAFLLGEVFDVTSEEGAYIMDISPVNYRKKLSRARIQMDEFLGKNCGLSSPQNSCRCKNRIEYSQKHKRIQSYLKLSEKIKASGEWKMKPLLFESNKIRKVAEIYKSGIDFVSRKNTLNLVKEGIQSKLWKIMN